MKIENGKLKLTIFNYWEKYWASLEIPKKSGMWYNFKHEQTKRTF